MQHPATSHDNGVITSFVVNYMKQKSYQRTSQIRNGTTDNTVEMARSSEEELQDQHSKLTSS